MGLECFEPYGAFYVFPCIKEFGMTSEEFATRFLEEEKVAAVPGTAFGDSGEGISENFLCLFPGKPESCHRQDWDISWRSYGLSRLQRKRKKQIKTTDGLIS